jgi:hypothetical protein
MDEQVVEFQLPNPYSFLEMLIGARKATSEALAEAKCGQNPFLIRHLQEEFAAWERLIARLEKRFP